MLPRQPQLSLWFTDSSCPQLDRTLFFHPLTDRECKCLRGRYLGVFRDHALFQWTRAVQALSILLLRSAASTNRVAGPAPFLSSDEHSSVASLDYAVSKAPQWIQDMFGWDSNGDPLIKRLIRRINPERKRPGPVLLSLNEDFLAACAITVSVNGTWVNSGERLVEFAEKIERGLEDGNSDKVEKNLGESAGDGATDGTFKDFITPIIRTEISHTLFATDIFTPGVLKDRVNGLQKDPFVTRFAGSEARLISELDLSLSTADRLGMYEDELSFQRAFCTSVPIRVALPITVPAALAIFKYLKASKGYNIEVVYNFAHTNELRSKLVDSEACGRIDLCLFGVATAASVLGLGPRFPFKPLMLMPGASITVASKQSKAAASSAGSADQVEYISSGPFPSSASFYFDELVRKGVVNRKKVRISHAEPDDILSRMRDADPATRAILFFPYQYINSYLNGCAMLDSNGSYMPIKDSVLFAHDSLHRDRNRIRLLDVAIRDAWLRLREDRDVFEESIMQVTSDPNYLRCLRRFGGLYGNSALQ